MAKIFGFRNAILNTLQCKIHCPNNVKVCSLPLVKFLEFYISKLFEAYILINIPKIHRQNITVIIYIHKYNSLYE